MHEFSYRLCQARTKEETMLQYKPEYKLKARIKEILYKLKAGINLFHNGLARIEVDRKWGFINIKGDVVIEPQYVETSDFINGYAAVKEEYDGYERLYEDPDSGEIESSYGTWGIINTDGEYMETSPIYDRINLYDNGIIIYAKGGSLDLYEDPDFGEIESYTTGSKYGIMDFHFKHLTPCKYSYCHLMKTGLIAASVTNNGLRRWGLLNTSGQEITEFKYSAIYNTSRRLMYANINSIWDEDDYVFYEGEWGALDATGKEIGPFIPARDLDDYISRKDE